MQPLAGVRVVDATRVLAGPFAAQTLGDLGAEVIKLERPGSGDDTRGWGPPFVGALSAYFLSANRNKRSLTLDIAQPAGRGLLGRLLERTDVLLENFRTASLPALGLTPGELLAAHPQLVVCSISGYGRTGPNRDLPGYDLSLQAESGLMSITGPVDGEPSKVGVALIDIITGLYAGLTALACLRERDRTGHGYHVDLALHDCAVATQVNVAQAYLATGEVPPRQGNAHLQIVPYQTFRTADGWLVLTVGNDSQWRQFCTAAGAVDLAADERFTRNEGRVRWRAELVPRVGALLAAHPTAWWQAQLRAANVPHALVGTHADAFASEQSAARNLRVTVRNPAGEPVDLVGSPIRINGATLPEPRYPPGLGEHTAAILAELGVPAAEQVHLRAGGVV